MSIVKLVKLAFKFYRVVFFFSSRSGSYFKVRLFDFYLVFMNILNNLSLQVFFPSQVYFRYRADLFPKRPVTLANSHIVNSKSY